MRKEYLENECYFYQIVEYNGEKYIKIDGYYYKTDSDFGDGYDRVVTISGLEIPLQEFVNYSIEYKVNTDLIDEMSEDCKQYYKDVVFEKEDDFYNNSSVTELSFLNVTMNTPCGCYVDYEESED